MKKIYHSQAIRYIFFGGCTTLVNLGSYYCLRNFLGIDLTRANFLAIFLSIVFAYVVNKLFVFEHHTDSVTGLLKEAAAFVGMRLGTMLVEIFGMLLLCCIWGVPEAVSKMGIQFAVLILNYLISRFVVFRDPEEDARSADAVLRKEAEARAVRFFLAGFGFSVLIAGAGFIAHGMWPFGTVRSALSSLTGGFFTGGEAKTYADCTMLIVDSLHQYLPFYTDFQQKLVNSESFLYSFSGGLGYNFWSTYAYYMASPINFLMAFIPMEHVCDFMDYAILFKIGLCGGCFSWYLHKRDPQRKYFPAVFGVLYALSNFVIGYYFNLMWLDSIAVLPLVMYGIERIVEGKSGRMFCVSLFFGLWCNYYIGFMLCIFSCLYFLVRWISAEQITGKKVFASCLNFGWYALLAGGMAALLLVPAFLGLVSSESMQSNSFPDKIKFYTNIAEMMMNHLAFLEPINIADSQVGLNAYCGVPTVLLAMLYLFDGKIRLRERLAHYALTAFLLLSFAMNILNYIWHGFHQQNGLPNRFAFLYVAVLLVMAYDALRDLGEFRFVELLFSFAVPAGLIGYSWWIKYDADLNLKDWQYFASFGILVLWFAFTLIGRYVVYREDAEEEETETDAAAEEQPGEEPVDILPESECSESTEEETFPEETERSEEYEDEEEPEEAYVPDRWRTVFSMILCAVLLIETTVNGVSGILQNGGVKRSMYVDDQLSWQAMMEEVGDDSFFRSEVDRQRMRNVTMFVGGHAMVMFNSTMQEAVINLCDSLGIEARTNKNGYLGVTKLINDVLGIRYVASPVKKADTLYQFEKIGKDGELTLYRNDNALSIGFMVNEEILDWDIDYEEPLDVQNDFVELATGHEPIFVLDRLIDMEDGENYGIRIPDNKQVYLCLDKRISKLELNTPEFEKKYDDYTDHLYVINSTTSSDENIADFTSTLKSSQTTVEAQVYTCANAAYQEVIDILAESQLEEVQVNGNTLSGTIDAKKSGILLLTIPYDKGWQICVDGVPTEYQTVGSALTGVPLTEGEHRIEMKYTPVGLWAGSLISFLCLFLFFLSGVVERRKHNR